jgi:hypothetical protein
MRIRSAIALSVLAVPPTSLALAQSGLPEGWSVRQDRPDRAIMFAAMGSGFHLSPGGAGIVYRAADQTGNKFHAVVTFNQTRAPTHPEAYGVFIAGNDLAADGQRYVYFIIRGDGQYSVKKREGPSASTIVPFTAHDALVKAGADGKAKNTVEVDATGDKVLLKVNGKTVYELAEANRAGIVGLRLNHGLDVHIDGFAVHKM